MNLLTSYLLKIYKSGISHNDLNLENIFVSENDCKIIVGENLQQNFDR